jgi:hypothetical protein
MAGLGSHLISLRKIDLEQVSAKGLPMTEAKSESLIHPFITGG